MESKELKRYKRIGTIGGLIAIFGMISVLILPQTFPKTIHDSYLGWTYTVPNVFFSYLGIVMVIGGGIISFYGRYNYTKKEEEEDIERMKKG